MSGMSGTPGTPRSTDRWRVVRQDDNGNVVVVAELADERAARALADDLEARAHKQLYWIERVDATARAST